MNYFLKISFLSLFLFFGFFCFYNNTSLAANNSPLVYIIEIDGDIKAGTSYSIKKAIKKAEKNSADYLLIKLNTPGGLVSSTKEITDAILDTHVDVIVFVNQEGRWAFSAGVFILMSADYMVVHPTASIGAAQPIPADEKMIKSMASWMNSLAETNNKDGIFAKRFVKENLTLIGTEAYNYNIIDAVALNIDQLFIKLNIENPEIRMIESSLLEKALNFLSNPFLMGLFLMLGTMGLIMAFRTGELCITGFISIFFLLIGIWGLGIISINLLGIILIGLGLVILGVEIFAEPGFGLLGLLGTGIIILGIFSIEKEPFFSGQITDPAILVVLGSAITLSALFLFIGKKTTKSVLKKPESGAESLINKKVVALKDFDPLGLIEIEGLKWTAKSIENKSIKKEDDLIIVQIKGNTAYVKKQNKT